MRKFNADACFLMIGFFAAALLLHFIVRWLSEDLNGGGESGIFLTFAIFAIGFVILAIAWFGYKFFTRD